MSHPTQNRLDVLGGLTELGVVEVGLSILKSASPTAVRTAIGATDTGSTLITASTPAVAREAIAPTHPAQPTMWVWDDGAESVFIRQSWDVTNDLLLKIEKVTTSSPINGIFSLAAFGSVLKTSEVGGTPTVTDSFESIQDDIVGYLTSYCGRFGGNHTPDLTAVTKASHGLTSADVGKRFSDSASAEFAIILIGTANLFYIVPKPKTAGVDTGQTSYQPASGDLTGMDGLGDITDCTYVYTSANHATNPFTACARRTQYFYVDGMPLVPGTICKAGKLEIIQYYEVPNVRNAFAYFVATGPTAAWTDAAMGSMLTRAQRYTFYPWGQLEIEDHSALKVSNIRFTNVAPLQFNPIVAGAGQYRWWHVPGAGVKTGVTWNGSAGQTVALNVPKYHASNSLMDYYAADTLVSGVPVDHTIELVATSNATLSGAAVRAHLAGFDPTYEDGLPAKRLANTPDGDQFWQLAATTKIYPYDRRANGARMAGLTFRYRAHRSWFIPDASGEIARWVKSGDKWLGYFTWQTADGSVTYTLPNYVPYGTVTSVRALNGALVSTNSAGGVTINQTASDGFVIVSLQ